jgi:hypothetical protein
MPTAGLFYASASTGFGILDRRTSFASGSILTTSSRSARSAPRRIAVEQFNLSVLRSRFCSDPDHARWDSRVATKSGEAYVYPDWLVIQFSIADASLTRTPENTAAQVHTLRAAHAPLSDNYAHSELWLFKGDSPKRILKDKLADRARIRLQSNEGCSFVAKHECRIVTKRLFLRASFDSNSPRCGILPARTVVSVQEVRG